MSVKKFISDYRVFPRCFVLVYFAVCIDIFNWFMALENPNEAQSAFVIVIAGGLVYAMKSYSTTGVQKFKIKEEFSHIDSVNINNEL